VSAPLKSVTTASQKCTFTSTIRQGVPCGKVVKEGTLRCNKHQPCQGPGSGPCPRDNLAVTGRDGGNSKRCCKCQKEFLAGEEKKEAAKKEVPVVSTAIKEEGFRHMKEKHNEQVATGGRQVTTDEVKMQIEEWSGPGVSLVSASGTEEKEEVPRHASRLYLRNMPCQLPSSL